MAQILRWGPPPRVLVLLLLYAHGVAAVEVLQTISGSAGSRRSRAPSRRALAELNATDTPPRTWQSNGERVVHGKCQGPKLMQRLPKKRRFILTMGGKPTAEGMFSGQKHESCAVVGNSGNLQANRYGKVISTHDVVIRMNQAPMTGYTDLVGNKTTFRVINKEWVKKYSVGIEWLPMDPGMSLVSRGDNEMRIKRHKYTCVLCHRDYRAKMQKWSLQSNVSVYRLSSDHVQSTWAMLTTFAKCSPVRAPKCSNCKPSSGILAVTLALSLCQNVTVYGMAGSRTNERWAYHYYKFHDTELRKGYVGHMFEVERQMVSQLHKDGVLSLCGPENAHTCSEPDWRIHPCCQVPPETSPPPAPPQSPALPAAQTPETGSLNVGHPLPSHTEP